VFWRSSSLGGRRPHLDIGPWLLAQALVLVHEYPFRHGGGGLAAAAKRSSCTVADWVVDPSRGVVGLRAVQCSAVARVCEESVDVDM
jgi:hypothetical protein